MRVVVVGAGIGGTSAALDLRSRGIDVEVFERTPEPRPLGGGLFMWSNGMNALRHVGLADEVASLGEEIVHFEFSTERGRRIGKMYFGESAKELGAPTVCLIRAELSEALVGAVPDEIINFGMECTGFEQDEAGVTVRFANGHEERCDVLVGADGRDSLIRRTLLGAPEDRFFGLTSWRAVIPFEHPEAPPQTVRSFFGCGEQFIFHPVGKGRQFWAAIAAAPPGGHDVEGELKPALLERFEKYPTPVREIVEATEESAIIRMDVVDRPPAPRWGEGRVTLLGDAIHLMAPMAGQGACQGLEDAIVLGNCLGRNGDVESALRSYEAARQPRTASVGNLAHRNASNVAVKSRPGCVMRNMMMRAMWAGPAPKAFVKMLSQVPAVERAA